MQLRCTMRPMCGLLRVGAHARNDSGVGALIPYAAGANSAGAGVVSDVNGVCDAREGRGSRVTKKILVADDEVSIAELLEQSLSEEGYQVYKATQSLRFYDAVRENHPDLILLDLMMPYLEGEDELRLMQLSPDTSDIPVIVVTAKQDVSKDEATLRSLGVRHIVRKPFDLNNLISLVRQTIG